MVKNKKTKYISGPYNIIHLRGQIDGLQKDIYIMFDIHNGKEYETPCTDKNAKDVINFLDKKFKNTKEELDFMIEIHPSDLISKNWYRNTIYIEKIWTFARNAFTMTNDNTTVIKSKQYPNVRIHYIDVRDVYFKLVWVYEFEEIMYNNLTYEICEQYKNYDVPKQFVKFVFKRIEEITKILLKSNIKSAEKFNMLQFFSINNVNSIHPEEKYKMLKYIVHKTQSRVTNKKLADCLNYIKNEIKLYFNNIKNNIYAKIMSYKKADTANDLKFFFDMTHKFYIDIIIFSIFLMDLYAIKRIIEKDYIKKIILYVGGLHATHYIMLLIKFFNFQIISISKNPESSIPILTEKILNNSNLFDIHETMFWTENILNQCSDSSPMSDV